MSDTVSIALISAVGVAVPSIFGAVMAYMTQRLTRETHKTMRKLEENTNGINADLLKLTASAWHAEGVKQEQERTKST